MERSERLVVRKKKEGRQERYCAGFSKEYPLSEGWEGVLDFGIWYGSQMNKPAFRMAHKKAILAATLLSHGEMVNEGTPYQAMLEMEVCHARPTQKI